MRCMQTNEGTHFQPFPCFSLIDLLTIIRSNANGIKKEYAIAAMGGLWIAPSRTRSVKRERKKSMKQVKSQTTLIN